MEEETSGTKKQKTTPTMDEQERNPEPLFQENKNKYVMHPIKYNAAYEMWKKSLASFWVPGEIDFTGDQKDWDSLTEGGQRAVKYVLAFFAGSDGLIGENALLKNYEQIKHQEVRAFYSMQAAMEDIHNKVYADAIDFFIKNEEEKEKLFASLSNFPSIKKMTTWMQKNLAHDQNNAEETFPRRLLVGALAEGIFFSGPFCVIFWLKKQNKLISGLGTSNELISRDEGMHVEFAVLLYTTMIANPLPEEEVYQLVDEAVKLECEFVHEALPIEMLGMNAQLMDQYIRFIADRFLVSLGLGKKYKDPCPFEWMETISLQGKSNFFEKRVSEYQKAGAAAEIPEHKQFRTDIDF